jgi:catechol O-methyltransferase
VVLELGGYFGYSALKIARLLGDDAKLYSVEPNPIRAAVATRLLTHAGLNHKVQIINDFSDKAINNLRTKYKIGSVDFVFIDHVKHRYLADLQLLESKEGMLKPGTVLVADNIKYPGAPDYKKHVMTSSRYKTTIVEYKAAAMATFDDEVAVSTVQ